MKDNNKPFHNPSKEESAPEGNVIILEKLDFEPTTKPELVGHMIGALFAFQALITKLN